MKRFCLQLLSLLLITIVNLAAQDSTGSLAFKNKGPQQKAPYFYRPDLAYQIWQKFKLTQEANAGDALAQHELGLRYLLGEGTPADTAQAVYWVKKAADQNLISAKYNYAIFLINGIGVPWDPYSAFKYFKSAANDGMVQAQYVVGILYTDNLTVKRNWNLAYYWIKKASNNDYEPAKEIVAKLKPRASKTIVDSLLNTTGTSGEINPVPEPSENLTSSLGLVFIDFETITDSTITITDSMLIGDIDIIGADSLSKILLTSKPSSLNNFVNPDDIKILIMLAENGSPEAQTILGRMYEKGIYFDKNLIDAAVYYYRALRNDSPTGTQLLWQLSREEEFLQLIQTEFEHENNLAKFLWYGLTATGFDRRITINDAVNLLEESANSYCLPAMIESGLNDYTGRYGRKNLETALKLWKNAIRLGSKEAEIRLTASRLIDAVEKKNPTEDFKQLKKAADEGSLFAMVSVALCYDRGLGTKKSLTDAVKYFRLAAQRGNRFAYDELKRIYDAKRPADTEFSISN